MSGKPKQIGIKDMIIETGMSADFFRKKIEGGEFKAYKYGGSTSPYKVERKEFEVWMEKHLVKVSE